MLKTTFKDAKFMGIKRNEWHKILKILKRNPNHCELGIYSAMWSEHCSYKSSKNWLKKLPVTGECVIQGPGENAGVIDIGNGLAAIFKIESHNHPSFIEPFQGAATGVGGILRDVFTMGARPVALLNALRFGDISYNKTKHLLSGVIRGIGGYGNCIGVPTVGGEINFHKSYNKNILVNAMAVGIAKKNNIFYSAASGVNFPLIYVGAKTGRDGIHGATMASSEFSDEIEKKKPTVQVGDPFTGKLLMEACLELMSTKTIIAIQDMGAAGLTSSSVEMASKGNLGIEIDLDLVPVREKNMSDYEIMLSESQERMLMVIHPEKFNEAYKIFNKWELDFVPIGKIIKTRSLILKKDDKTVCDIPISSLVEDSPEYKRNFKYQKKSYKTKKFKFSKNIDITEVLKKLISSSDLCSKKWVWEQYDSEVMSDTINGPGGDAAIVRVQGTKKALALTTDCTPRYVFADAYEGSKQAVAEAYRNISATGAIPQALTNNLNFGSPEKPQIMGQLIKSIEGISKACKVLEIPVVSGNVSLYNETDNKSIQPCPVIGMVGKIENWKNLVNSSFVDCDEKIYVLGQNNKKLDGWLECSIYAKIITKIESGNPPPINLEKEKKYAKFVQKLIKEKIITSAHDISDGGLLISIAEMFLSSNFGAKINLPKSDTLHSWAFGEDQCRYIITTKKPELLKKKIKQEFLEITELGKTTKIEELKIGEKNTIYKDELRKMHENFFNNLY